MAKIPDATSDLRAQVALVAERQNGVTIALRDGIAVAAMALRAGSIGGDDTRVSRRMVAFEPDHQRRPEVETDVGVVVDDAIEPAVAVHDAGDRVGPVVFAVD